LQLAKFLAGEHSLLGGAVLFGVTFGLYLATRSHSLDDWDSVNFARAIEKFDLALQQPHPPGYPAYVFLSRLVNLVTNDPLISLTSLSAICGALGVLAFYALACDLGVGWAALPLATMPLFWLNSEMALTDVPGLTFTLVSVWLLNRAVMAGPSESFWRSRRVCLIAGCAAGGVGAGVRPQDALVPAVVMVFYALPRLWRTRERSDGLMSDLGLATGALLLTCALWGIPLYQNLTQGPVPFEPYKVQLQYIRDWDSLMADPAGPYADEPAPFTLERVTARLAVFGSVFSGYFGGPREAGIRGFAGLALATLILVALGRRAKIAHLAGVWLIFYWPVMLLVMQPNDPRKILPAIPPMLLLLAGAATLRHSGLWRGIVACACLALTGVFAAKAVPLVRTLDRVPTPPEQVSSYIANWYSPDDTIILAATSLNHIRYLIPQFTSFSIIDTDDEELALQLDQRPVRYILVVDQDGPTIPPMYGQTDIRAFERDSLVLPKGSYASVTEYTRRDAAPEAEANQPAAD
jgi:hypothetical protein